MVSKKNSINMLTEIPGVGRARARVLYDHGFETIDELRKVTAEELSERITSIPLEIAEEIITYLIERFPDEILEDEATPTDMEIDGLDDDLESLGKELDGSEDMGPVEQDVDTLKYANESLKKAVIKLQEDLRTQTTITNTISEEYQKIKKTLKKMDAGMADNMLELMKVVLTQAKFEDPIAYKKAVEAVIEMRASRTEENKSKNQDKP